MIRNQLTKTKLRCNSLGVQAVLQSELEFHLREPLK